MQELDVSNVRELEDFLINECMYSVSCYILFKFWLWYFSYFQWFLILLVLPKVFLTSYP
jgi:hypothetical protein